MQQTLEPFALLRVEGGGEHAPAAPIGALPCTSDESPKRAPPRQQNPAAHQELARAGEERPAALRGHPGARPEPLAELGLDAGGAERLIGIGAADLGLVRPAPFTLPVARQVSAR